MSFRLPFTHDQLERGDVGEMDAEEARLLAAIFEPISVRHANARQAHLVKGTPQTFTRADTEHTFMCRMWDAESRRCRIYKFRPPGCRTFPYGADCRYGCNECGTKPGPDVII